MTVALDTLIDQKRTDKAVRLATALRANGMTATDAVRLTAAARRGVEGVAGVRIGSQRTWQIAVGMLAGSARRRCPYCGTGDPMGVDGPAQDFGHEGPCSR